MKLPITEQFLLNLYDVLEGGADIAYSLLRPKKTMGDIFWDPDDPRIKRYFKDFSRRQFSKIIYNLKKGNFIRIKNLQGKQAISITKKGIGRAIKVKFKTKKGTYQKRKDNKWIMVIFDIPKRDEGKRGILRSILQNLGYEMFQKSVWITPYDVSEKTEELLQLYDLEDYIRIFIIEKIS